MGRNGEIVHMAPKDAFPKSSSVPSQFCTSDPIRPEWVEWVEWVAQIHVNTIWVEQHDGITSFPTFFHVFVLGLQLSSIRTTATSHSSPIPLPFGTWYSDASPGFTWAHQVGHGRAPVWCSSWKPRADRREPSAAAVKLGPPEQTRRVRRVKLGTHSETAQTSSVLTRRFDKIQWGRSALSFIFEVGLFQPRFRATISNAVVRRQGDGVWALSWVVTGLRGRGRAEKRLRQSCCRSLDARALCDDAPSQVEKSCFVKWFGWIDSEWGQSSRIYSMSQ